MLYTVGMNTKPNLPEEIGFGKMNLWGSWRGSLNKGGAIWMFVVYLTDIPGDWLIKHHPGWPLALRLLIALFPLAASLLYARGFAAWTNCIAASLWEPSCSAQPYISFSMPAGRF